MGSNTSSTAKKKKSQLKEQKDNANVTSKEATAATAASTNATSTTADSDSASAPKETKNGNKIKTPVPGDQVPFVAPGPGAFSFSKPLTDVPYGKSGEVDYDAVRRDLKEMMVDPNWDDGSYAPLLIRLAWHASGTYDAETNTGGSFQSGATMRHQIEAADPENAGLGHARMILEPVRKKHPNISYADLWILAGYVALEVTDGPVIEFTPGRPDGGPDKQVKPGRLPGAEHGLAPGVDEQGRPNQWRNLAAHIRQVFGRMGLSEREAVALICGGHVYGRCHQEHSGYAGAWVEMPTRFSNEYAADMIEDDWKLVSHDTQMPDGTAVPPDVCPIAGRRQYIGVADEEEEEEDKADETIVNAKDFKELPVGKYELDAEWVNCRESPDTGSAILARPEKGAVFNILVIKQFETAIRGQLETGGWVSLQALSGARYWKRLGDIELSDGAHRVSVGKKAALFSAIPDDASSEADSHVQETTWLDLEQVQSHPSDNTAIFGKVVAARALSQGPTALQTPGKAVGQWVRMCTGDRGVVVERIVKGFNEKPRKPLKQLSHQMMLVSDMVLLWDEGFRPHLEDFAKDIDVLRDEFGCAFKKLTELGCPWTRKSDESKKVSEDASDAKKTTDTKESTDDNVSDANPSAGQPSTGHPSTSGCPMGY